MGFEPISGEGKSIGTVKVSILPKERAIRRKVTRIGVKNH